MKTKVARYKRLNSKLKLRNKELEETLQAVQTGEIDALVVDGPLGERIYTLKSEEQPFRELVEAMNEGAVTVSSEGLILYCNTKFDSMMKEPSGKLIGSDFKSLVCLESKNILKALLLRSKNKPSTAEIFLNVADQIALPVKLSVSAIELVGNDGFCIITTDLSEQKQNAIIFQQQEWLAALLNLLPVPLVVLDSDLKGFSFINAKATEMLHEMKPIFLSFENEKEEVLNIRDLLIKIEEKKLLGIETILSTGFKKFQFFYFSKSFPLCTDAKRPDL